MRGWFSVLDYFPPEVSDADVANHRLHNPRSSNLIAPNEILHRLQSKIRRQRELLPDRWRSLGGRSRVRSSILCLTASIRWKRFWERVEWGCLSARHILLGDRVAIKVFRRKSEPMQSGCAASAAKDRPRVAFAIPTP